MTSNRNSVNQICAALLFVSMGVMVAGTKACQEDYDLGSKTTTPKASATVVATETDNQDGIISDTPTPTPTSTVTATPTEAPDVTSTTAPATTIGTGAVRSGQSADFLQELSLLGTPKPELLKSAQANGAKPSSNWLGKSFNGDANSDQQPNKLADSDGDGFTDWLEQRFGTDPHDANSVPSATTTKLTDRLRGIDDDGDGLSNQEEIEKGLNPANPDTDGDTRLDGVEVLSGEDPASTVQRYPDSDADGLSDQLENSRHTNPQAADTDGDGLSDAQEIGIGSDPTNPDTDGDGILDGKEFDLGSDPTRPESR